jgi:hypothetical protein
MASSRAIQLGKIAETLAPQRVAPQQQLAESQRIMSMQQQQAASPGMTPIQQRQLAAQQTAQQTQGLLQPQAQASTAAVGLSQKASEQEQAATQQAMNEQRFSLGKKQRDLQRKLEGISSQLKNELFDKQMSFSKDELGRTQWNERQLADWKLATAKNDEEFRDYQQHVEQLSQKKMMLLKAAQAKIAQEQKQLWESGEQEKNQAQSQRLAQAKVDADNKLRKQEAKAKNRAAMYRGIGQVVGAVAGAVIGIPGGPAGIAAGASAGASVGGALGGMAAASDTKAPALGNTGAAGLGFAAGGPLGAAAAYTGKTGLFGK